MEKQTSRLRTPIGKAIGQAASDRRYFNARCDTHVCVFVKDRVRHVIMYIAYAFRKYTQQYVQLKA